MKLVNFNQIVTIVECVNKDCWEVESEVEFRVKQFIEFLSPYILRNPIFRSPLRLKNTRLMIHQLVIMM